MVHQVKDIQIDHVLARLACTTQDNVFDELVKALVSGTRTRLSEHRLLEDMIEMEKIQPSGIGCGVAIPFLRMPYLQKAHKALATLQTPLAMNTPDGQDVDIICAVLVPESEGNTSLRRLSRITRFFKNEDLCNRMREMKTSDDLRGLLMNPDGWLLAA